MAFQFPINPTLGQSITNPSSSVIYVWDGTAWSTGPVTASLALTASYAVNGGAVIISDNAPSGSNVNTGSLWFNSNDLGIYVNYYDTDGRQWVAAAPVGPVSTASFAQTASFLPNSVISYPIPNLTVNQWILLGTWITGQEGQTLKMSISSHSGFNAQFSQNQSTELYLVTSNGSSTNPSASLVYLSGQASRDANLGTNTFAPSQFRIVQNSTTNYSVYAYFGTWTANSHYTISVNPGTSWIHSGTVPGITPVGTFLDIFPAQSGRMAYANFTFNNFPTIAGNDFTPIIGNADGISTSGNIITLANAGVYMLQANIAVRSTFAVYAWVDTSNVRLVGTVDGVSVSANSSDTASPAPAAGIINVTAGTQIKLRLTNQSGAQNTFREYASAQIIQIR